MIYWFSWGRRGCHRMVVRFTSTCVINTYHHLSCEVEYRSWRDVLDTTLCDQVCQWLAEGRWFSSGILVSSTNKTDYHDITKILLKVALNATTITLLFLLGRLLQGSFSSVRVQFGVYITNSSSFNISFCFPFVSRYAVKNFSDVMHAEWSRSQKALHTDI